MTRGAVTMGRRWGLAAAALTLTAVAATFSAGPLTQTALADTVPCFNQNGQPVPCPTTTTPPPSPPPTSPPTTAPPPPPTAPPPSPPPTAPPASYPPPPPPVTSPPPPPPTQAPTTAAPTTTSTTVPKTTTSQGPPAIFGGGLNTSPLPTTTAPPDPPATDANQLAVGIPKAKEISPTFVAAMIVDALLLIGIAGYVVARRARGATAS